MDPVKVPLLCTKLKNCNLLLNNNNSVINIFYSMSTEYLE